MGYAAAVLAALTVSFLFLPWAERLLAVWRDGQHQRTRKEGSALPAAASASAAARGGEAAEKAHKKGEETKEEEGKKREKKGQNAGAAASAAVSSQPFESKTTTISPSVVAIAANDADDSLPSVSDPGQWRRLRCFCEGGGIVSFLPPGAVQDQLQSAGALLRMGAGGCYHKPTKQR